VNTINALYCQLFILIKTAFVPLIQVYFKEEKYLIKFQMIIFVNYSDI
jgi:hypothetical protein